MTRLTQHVIETLTAANLNVRVSQYLVEVATARITPSPTSITGAGVSQHLVEVLCYAPRTVEVSQYVVEALVVSVERSPSVATATVAWVSIS